MAGNVNIKITGDPSSAKKAFATTGAAAQTLDKRFDALKAGVAKIPAGFTATQNAGQKLHAHFSSLTGTILKLSAAFGGLYGLKRAVEFLDSGADAAAEDAKQVAILHQAISNLTGATEEQLGTLDQWIDKTQRATGIAEEKLRPAMVKLVTATKDTEVAQHLLNVAMDTAVARGQDVDTIATALAKAYNGNVGALGRLGIATKDASGKTKDFATILKDLEAAYGGTAAAAAATYAGKIERIKVAFAEAKEALGAAFLPALDKLSQMLLQVMPTLEKFGVAIGEKISGVVTWVADTLIPKLVEAYTWLRDQIADKNTAIGGALDALRALFEAVWPAIHEVVAEFIEWLQGPTGQSAITAALGLITGGLTIMRQVFEAVWPALQPIVQRFIDWLNSEEGQGLITRLLDGIGVVLDLLSQAFQEVWPVIRGVIEEFIGWFSSPDGQAFINDLLNGIESVLNDLRDVWNTVWPAIRRLVEDFVRWFRSPDGQEAIRSLLQGLKDIAASLQSLWEEVWPAMQMVVQAAIPNISKNITSLMEVIGPLVQLIGKLLEGFARLQNSPFKWVTGLGVLTGLAGLVGGHAEGALFQRPEVALVGEDGPELLLPLTKPRRMQQLMKQAGLAFANGGLVGGPPPALTEWLANPENESSSLARAIRAWLNESNPETTATVPDWFAELIANPGTTLSKEQRSLLREMFPGIDLPVNRGFSGSLGNTPSASVNASDLIRAEMEKSPAQAPETSVLEAILAALKQSLAQPRQLNIYAYGEEGAREARNLALALQGA